LNLQNKNLKGKQSRKGSENSSRKDKEQEQEENVEKVSSPHFENDRKVDFFNPSSFISLNSFHH